MFQPSGYLVDQRPIEKVYGWTAKLSYTVAEHCTLHRVIQSPLELYKSIILRDLKVLNKISTINTLKLYIPLLKTNILTLKWNTLLLSFIENTFRIYLYKKNIYSTIPLLKRVDTIPVKKTRFYHPFMAAFNSLLQVVIIMLRKLRADLTYLGRN